MSAVVKLGSKLPGDFETNGLDALHDDLVKRPEQLRIAVVWIDVAKVETSTDSGAQVPTVRVRRIEPLGDVGDASETIRQQVAAAIEKRTGQAPLDFETSEILHVDDYEG